MGKANKDLKAFIEEIPDDSLNALPTIPGTIYSDIDFRLDMQGVSITLPLRLDRPSFDSCADDNRSRTQSPSPDQ